MFRRFFDPAAYRIVLFDQRGAGKSLPHACLEDNSTWDLVEDIEKLRQHLDIRKWQVYGGSWGSTLALAYAQSHPERTTELILRGIFLSRTSEIDWLVRQGASELYPDEWELFKNAIPPEEQADLLTAYHRRLTSDNPTVRLGAARAWHRWETAMLHLMPHPEELESATDDEILSLARIECHYFVNKGFLRSDRQLLDGVDIIRHIPAVIVQGRHDTITPLKSAWDLHRQWPEAQLKIIADAAHASSEDGIVHELVSATDLFKERN
jgi:proline iminopeptidase